MDPKERLRYHVTGAIERGEAEAITEVPVQMDEFTLGYIEAALWSSHNWTEEDPDDTSFLDLGYWVEDMDPALLQQMRQDCTDFQQANIKKLRLAYRRDGYGPSEAGHDFWFTRVGHGVGFWDRGLGSLGDQLTEASEAYGSLDLYLGDDGKIYGG